MTNIHACRRVVFALCRESDLESGEAIRIGTQREEATMAIQNLTDEYQSQSLSVGLGGEEGGEQLGFGLLVDALSIVRNLHAGRVSKGLDHDTPLFANGFYCVLDDIHQDLLEERGVYGDDRGRIV